jgi:hypothetical protein
MARQPCRAHHNCVLDPLFSGLSFLSLAKRSEKEKSDLWCGMNCTYAQTLFYTHTAIIAMHPEKDFRCPHHFRLERRC